VPAFASEQDSSHLKNCGDLSVLEASQLLAP